MWRDSYVLKIEFDHDVPGGSKDDITAAGSSAVVAAILRTVAANDYSLAQLKRIEVKRCG